MRRGRSTGKNLGWKAFARPHVWLLLGVSLLGIAEVHDDGDPTERSEVGDRFCYVPENPTTLAEGELQSQRGRERNNPSIRTQNVKGLGKTIYSTELPLGIDQPITIRPALGAGVPAPKAGEFIIAAEESTQAMEPVIITPLSKDEYLFARNDGWVGTSRVIGQSVGTKAGTELVGLIPKDNLSVELSSSGYVALQGKNRKLQVFQLTKPSSGFTSLTPLELPEPYTEPLAKNSVLRFGERGDELFVIEVPVNGSNIEIGKFLLNKDSAPEVKKRTFRIDPDAPISRTATPDIQFSRTGRFVSIELATLGNGTGGVQNNRYLIESTPGSHEFEGKGGPTLPDFRFVGLIDSSGNNEPKAEWLDTRGRRHVTSLRNAERELYRCVEYTLLPVSDRESPGTERRQEILNEAFDALAAHGLCDGRGGGHNVQPLTDQLVQRFRREMEALSAAGQPRTTSVKWMLYWLKPGAFVPENDAEQLVPIIRSGYFRNNFPELFARLLNRIFLDHPYLFEKMRSEFESKMDLEGMALAGRLDNAEIAYESCLTTSELGNELNATVERVKNVIGQIVGPERPIRGTKISDWKLLNIFGPTLSRLDEVTRYELHGDVEDSIEVGTMQSRSLAPLDDGLKNSFIVNRIGPLFGKPLKYISDLKFTGERNALNERTLRFVVGNPVREVKLDGLLVLQSHSRDNIENYGMSAITLAIPEGTHELTWTQFSRRYKANVSWDNGVSAGTTANYTVPEERVNEVLNQNTSCAFYDELSNNVRNNLTGPRLAAEMDPERKKRHVIVSRTSDGRGLLNKCLALKNVVGTGGCSGIEIVGHLTWQGVGASGLFDYENEHHHTPQDETIFSSTVECFKELLPASSPVIMTSCGSASGRQEVGLVNLCRRLGRPIFAAKGYCNGDGYGAHCRRGWIGIAPREARGPQQLINVQWTLRE